MAALVGFRLHRGVVAIAGRPAGTIPTSVLAAAAATASVDGGPPLVVVLEGLNDPENIGSRLPQRRRLRGRCRAPRPDLRRPPLPPGGAGLGGPRPPPAVGPPRPVAGGAGTGPGGRIRRCAPWLPTRRRAGAAGAEQVSLATLASRRRPVAVLLGAEGPGLSPAALDAADVVVTIPMARGVDSLNVATTAAVALARLAGRLIPVPGLREAEPGRLSLGVPDPTDDGARVTDSTIIYTHTDEAPLLATYSLLPVVQAYAAQAGVSVATRDISLAGRILASFPDRLRRRPAGRGRPGRARP